MPIFDFECVNCQRILKDAFVARDQPNPVCEECSRVTNRLIGAPSFHFKGGGWFKKPPNEPASAVQLSKVQTEVFGEK